MHRPVATRNGVCVLRKAMKPENKKIGIALSLFLMVVLASCSSGENAENISYDIPSDLCGVELEESVLSPIFPPGEEIEIEGGLEYSDPYSNCIIRVDGELVIYVATSAGEHDFIGYYGLGPQAWDPIKPEEGVSVPGEYRAMAWPNAVFGYVPCKWEFFNTGFTAGIWSSFPEGDDESIEALSGLINPYLSKVVDASGCVMQ
jgi:hypothetical protein